MFESQTWDGQNFMHDCEKDNTIKFNSNGTYTEDDGADICSDGDVSDKWSLINNDSKIIMAEDTFNLDQVTATTLQASQTYEGKAFIIKLKAK